MRESNPPPAVLLMLHQLSYTLYSCFHPLRGGPFGVAGLEPASFNSFMPCGPRRSRHKITIKLENLIVWPCIPESNRGRTGMFRWSTVDLCAGPLAGTTSREDGGTHPQCQLGSC